MVFVGTISEYNPISRISHAVIDILMVIDSLKSKSFLLNDEGPKISIVNPKIIDGLTFQTVDRFPTIVKRTLYLQIPSSGMSAGFRKSNSRAASF